VMSVDSKFYRRSSEKGDANSFQPIANGSG